MLVVPEPAPDERVRQSVLAPSKLPIRREEIVDINSKKKTLRLNMMIHDWVLFLFLIVIVSLFVMGKLGSLLPFYQKVEKCTAISNFRLIVKNYVPLH